MTASAILDYLCDSLVIDSSAVVPGAEGYEKLAGGDTHRWPIETNPARRGGGTRRFWR
jgi:hypothetical protein